MTIQSPDATPPPVDIMEPIFYLAKVHRRFAEKMILSLENHTLAGKSGWDANDWSLADIKVSIVRCVMRDDFVAAAHYAMFADHHANTSEQAIAQAQTKAVGGIPARI